MPQVHGLPPADEQKDTSRDCDKGDNNNNNWYRKSTREDMTISPDWSTGSSVVSMT